MSNCLGAWIASKHADALGCLGQMGKGSLHSRFVLITDHVEIKRIFPGTSLMGLDSIFARSMSRKENTAIARNSDPGWLATRKTIEVLRSADVLSVVIES